MNEIDRAREQGLEGSGYEGWICDVPESEIENARVEKIDLPPQPHRR